MKTIFAISTAIFLSGCGCADCQTIDREHVLFALSLFGVPFLVIAGCELFAIVIAIARWLRSKPGDDIDPYDSNFYHDKGD